MDSLPDSRMIRTSSKLTDELVTLDSPRRHSRMFSKSMYNTTQQFRKKLSQSKNLILADASSLWQQSATTYTREKSPSFGFSQAQRFSSLEQDERRNRLILKLNIANQLCKFNGVSFAKSKRIDHFKPKKHFEDYPSPASYCSEILGSKLTQRRVSTASGKRSSFMKLADTCKSYEIKGVTVPKQKNPHKVFQHHGQNLPYQPEITMNNPGVGKYQLNPQNEADSTKKFYIGQALKKFNQIIEPNPGPGAYGKQIQILPKRVQSANCKGTFQMSKRTYLVDSHPENFSPSPASYKLKRFLEK